MLELQNLSYSFNNVPSNQCILANINAVIKPGNYLEILGKNGSGKTTLLKLLSGLKSPKSGTIKYKNIPITNNNLDQYLSNICYLGHNNALYKDLSALENLQFYIKFNNLDVGFDTIISLLSKFSLYHLADEYCRNLSKGQLQRLALLRLLIRNSEIWILDEPLSALDINGINLATDIILQKVSKGGIVIAATHQPLDVLDKYKIEFKL